MADKAYYARVKPYNPRRGCKIQGYTYKRQQFKGGDGVETIPVWYRVSAQTARELLQLKQSDTNPDAPGVFDVCNEQQMRRINAVEADARMRHFGRGTQSISDLPETRRVHAQVMGLDEDSNLPSLEDVDSGRANTATISELQLQKDRARRANPTLSMQDIRGEEETPADPGPLEKALKVRKAERQRQKELDVLDAEEVDPGEEAIRNLPARESAFEELDTGDEVDPDSLVDLTEMDVPLEEGEVRLGTQGGRGSFQGAEPIDESSAVPKHVREAHMEAAAARAEYAQIQKLQQEAMQQSELEDSLEADESEVEAKQTRKRKSNGPPQPRQQRRRGRKTK